LLFSGSKRAQELTKKNAHANLMAVYIRGGVSSVMTIITEFSAQIKSAWAIAKPRSRLAGATILVTQAAVFTQATFPSLANIPATDFSNVEKVFLGTITYLFAMMSGLVVSTGALTAAPLIVFSDKSYQTKRRDSQR
jgi:hypothetical protein